MENENNVSGKKSNKLLIALTILVALNLVVGIVNIGLSVNRNIGRHSLAREFGKDRMRQESMFNGFNQGRFENRNFNKNPFSENPFSKNTRPNFENKGREFNAPNEQKNESVAPRTNESSGPN